MTETTAVPVRFELTPTPRSWLEVVLGNFDEFLRDHASCEKKASGMALSIASHYPDQPRLLAAMADLAVEELSHYREVLRLMARRGVTPGPDVRDPYVRGLNQLIRRGPEHYLLDRLLVAAIVERRGHERFALIAGALEDPAERRFYQSISTSEARHWQLFVDLAREHCDQAALPERLSELVSSEAALMLSLPARAALH